MFQLAVSFDYVAHMLVSASAERLKIRTESDDAVVDAYRYQAMALRGIREAVLTISRDNADAILAAALGCAYQMPDWFVNNARAVYGLN